MANGKQWSDYAHCPHPPPLCLLIRSSLSVGRKSFSGERADESRWGCPEGVGIHLTVSVKVRRADYYCSPHLSVLASRLGHGSSSCTLTIAQCATKATGASNWRDALTSPPVFSYASSHCKTEPSTDYLGGDLTVETGVDLDGCCKACTENSGCQFFTFNTESGSCYLKSLKSSDVRRGAGHLISGQTLR
jgi:hypothetical protein